MQNVGGDATSWAGDIDYSRFLEGILRCIVESWPNIATPLPDEGEDEVTVRLFGQMKLHHWARRSPFRMTLQAQYVPAGGAEVAGIPDILIETLAPPWEEEFVSIECKRLRRKDGTQPCRSGNAEYIDGDGQGMTAFTSGRYPSPCAEAIMVGYILCSCKRPLETLERELGNKAALIRLDTVRIPAFGASAVLPENPNLRETYHLPDPSTKLRRISHVFLHSDVCKGPPTPAKVSQRLGSRMVRRSANRGRAPRGEESP